VIDKKMMQWYFLNIVFNCVTITYGTFTINTMHVNELKKQRLVGIDIYETEDRNRKPFQTLLM
jgi:hypothetical protein